jgi:hypothetical protein
MALQRSKGHFPPMSRSSGDKIWSVDPDLVDVISTAFQDLLNETLIAMLR